MLSANISLPYKWITEATMMDFHPAELKVILRRKRNEDPERVEVIVVGLGGDENVSTLPQWMTTNTDVKRADRGQLYALDHIRRILKHPD